METKKLSIAIIGIRGIPVPYSGFETLAEQLSIRLVQRGHQVTVYCRKSYVKSNKTQYKRVSLVSLPSPKSKNFETIIHSFISTVHAVISRKFDLIFFLGVGNAPISFIPRIFGIKTLININGLDWQRKKWSIIGKNYLLFSEWSSQFFPSQAMTDTTFTKNYYKKKYAKDITHIPNGYIQFKITSQKMLKKYGLMKNKYIITVGRLVPDNNLEELILAFKKVPSLQKCVIVGGDHYDYNYQKKIKNMAQNDKRIIFTGFIKQEENLQLLKNAYAYIETKRSGGSHPSLIEAMGLGCLIIANNSTATKSIIGDNCIFYDTNDGWISLKNKIQEVVKNKLLSAIKKATLNHARRFYNWDNICLKYEELFYSITSKPR